MPRLQPHVFQHLEICPCWDALPAEVYDAFVTPSDLDALRTREEDWADLVEPELGPISPDTVAVPLSPQETLELCLRGLDLFNTGDDTCMKDSRILPPQLLQCHTKTALVRSLASDLKGYESAMGMLADVTVSKYQKYNRAMIAKLERFAKEYGEMKATRNVFKKHSGPRPLQLRKAVEIVRCAVDAVGDAETSAWKHTGRNYTRYRNDLINRICDSFSTWGPKANFPKESLYEAVSHILFSFRVSSNKMTTRGISACHRPSGSI